MASEGFEDSSYNQSIDVTNWNPCPLRQIGFIGMSNSKLVFTDTMTFAAHTGKYCMAVAPSSTASLLVPITTSPTLTYNLAFGKDTTLNLSNAGINIVYSPAFPSAAYQNSTPSAIVTSTDTLTLTVPTEGTAARVGTSGGTIGVTWGWVHKYSSEGELYFFYQGVMQL